MAAPPVIWQVIQTSAAADAGIHILTLHQKLEHAKEEAAASCLKIQLLLQISP